MALVHRRNTSLYDNWNHEEWHDTWANNLAGKMQWFAYYDIQAKPWLLVNP